MSHFYSILLNKNETCPIVKRPIFYQKRPITLSSLNNTKACHIFTLFYSIRTRHVILLRDLYSIKRDLLYCYHSITMRYVILLLYSITTRHGVLLLFNNVMSCRYLRSRMTWAMSHCYYSITSCHIGMTQKKSCHIVVHQLQRVMRNGRSTNWYFTAREMVKILKCRLYRDFTLSI